MLTYSETVARVRDIVAEKPEGYKYTEDPKTAERRAQYNQGDQSGTNCYYAHADGTAGCIVGHFVHKLKPDFDLKAVETNGVHSVLFKAGISVSSDSNQFLADVQMFQDRGETWTCAVDRAIEINSGWLVS